VDPVHLGARTWHVAAAGCFVEYMAMLEDGDDTAPTTTRTGPLSEDELPGTAPEEIHG
jgi:hypothetical protein